MILTKTQKRVLTSIHLQGCTGSMGSMNLAKRRALLHELVELELLDPKTAQLTPKGIELAFNQKKEV